MMSPITKKNITIIISFLLIFCAINKGISTMKVEILHNVNFDTAQSNMIENT